MVNKRNIALVVFIGLIILFWEWLRHPLPKQEGTIAVEGLNRPVEVYSDSYGVPHIYAENEEDLFFAAGYVAARDRLFQLSMVALAVKGGLASVLGPDYLEKDVYFRTWKIHETAKKLVENMSPDNETVFSTFCDGINYRIDEVLEDLPIEFKILRFKPDYWDPSIVAGYARMMAHEMSGSWKPEVVFGAVNSYFGKDMLMDLLPNEKIDIPTIYPLNQSDLLSSYNEIIKSEYSLRGLFGDVTADIGSNNWVVGPSRSVTGHAILANDPHLAFSQPPRWYEIHLIGGRFNVSGVCLAGIPLPVIGQNSRTAWGFTNSMVDDLDFYIEKINPDNKNQYFYEGKWLDMNISYEKFKIKGKQDTTIEVRSTHHGPIISSVHKLKQDNNNLLSIKWTGHWITNELDAWVELTTMDDWDDFNIAVKKFGVPGQNIVYADVDGNIGWRPCVYVPIRKKGNSFAPRPGWDSDYEWEGKIPFEQMPYIYNPPEGVISTANNRIVDGNYQYNISGLWADPSRSSRIKEYLSKKKILTLEDMKELQLDYTSKFAEEIAPQILKYSGTINNQLHKRALLYLQRWDYIEDVDSEGTLIFHSITNKILENIYYDELSLLGDEYFETFIGLKYITKRNLRSIFKNKNNKWIDDITTPDQVETIDQIITKSIDQGIEHVINTYGNNWTNWKWGNAHTVIHKHLLGKERLLDYLFDLNIGPFFSGGSDVTPNAGGYSGIHSFKQTSGASMRRIVDFSNLNMTRMILPTGQSGIPTSPNYNDQTELYHNGKYRYTYFDKQYIVESKEFKLLKLVPTNWK